MAENVKGGGLIADGGKEQVLLCMTTCRPHKLAGESLAGLT